MIDLQDQLLDSERVKVLTATTGAAAHQINQPLTVMMATVDILLRTMSPEEPKRSYIETFREAGQKISEIVNKMGSARQFITSPYAMGENIVDFDAAAQKGPQEGKS